MEPKPVDFTIRNPDDLDLVRWIVRNLESAVSLGTNEDGEQRLAAWRRVLREYYTRNASRATVA